MQLPLFPGMTSPDRLRRPQIWRAEPTRLMDDRRSRDLQMQAEMVGRLRAQLADLRDRVVDLEHLSGAADMDQAPAESFPRWASSATSTWDPVREARPLSAK